MAVAFDAVSESHTGSTSSTSETSFSWTHTPVGTPRGVSVLVISGAGSPPTIDSVLYGGVPLTLIATALDTNLEVFTTRLYHLGIGVPTGPQTVLVNRENTVGPTYAVAFTVTALIDTAVPLGSIVKLEADGALAEQNVDDGSPGTNSLRFAGGGSGRGTPPPVGGNSTAGPSIQYVINSAVTCRETTAGQGSRPVGFSDGTSDDRAFIHWAVIEQLSQSNAPRAIYNYRRRRV